LYSLANSNPELLREKSRRIRRSNSESDYFMRLGEESLETELMKVFLSKLPHPNETEVIMTCKNKLSFF